MKKIQLTQNKYTLVDDEDYDYLNQFNWYAHKSKNYWSAIRMSKRKIIIMHRVIMNCPDDKLVDHINHNSLDNRKENLRICNRKENARNSRLSKRNTSGIKGVSWNSDIKKWVSSIRINGKNTVLGRFKSLKSAKNAYEKVGLKYHKEFYSNGDILDGNNTMYDKNIKNKKTILRIDNTSNFNGINFDKKRKKWMSRITINGKRKYLGFFTNKNDAIKSYEKEKSKK